MRRLWPVLIVLLLTACACHKTPTVRPVGKTDFEVLPPPPYEPPPEGTRRQRVLPETYPEVQEQPPPTYPETALAAEVACTARLLYHVLADGSAKLVRLEWDAPPPAEYRVDFENEIRSAMLGWSFIPAQRWIPTKRDDGSIRLVPKPIPKAERAVVRFHVEGGRGIVE